MAQQQNVGIGGPSQPSSHSGGWTGSPSASVWDQTTRNIATGMEGAPSDFGSGRSGEWEVKNGNWEWDPVGPYSARHLDVHPSAVAFATSGQTVDGLPANTHGALAPKNEGFSHDNSQGNSSRVGITSVEQRTPPHSSILSTDQQRRLPLELGEGDRGKVIVPDFGNVSLVPVAPAGGGSSVAAAGTELNLKLGRGVYYEEPQGALAAGPSAPASAPPASAPAHPPAQAVYAVCPPGKKQRTQSPGAQVPRCQVEGCKQDLTGCKEYHKRHKVCEAHSKAARVVAGGLDQRFCQQCSRFHGLHEFDDGKRSCRRRLAGHNERRRKPPPEAASSGNSSAIFQNEPSGAHGGNVSSEERKRCNSGLTEQQACFVPMQRTPGSSSTSVESDEQSGSFGTNFKLNHGKGPSSWTVLARGDETTGLGQQQQQQQITMSERQPPYISPPASDRVLMFLHGPPNGAIAGSGVHHYPVEAATGPLGPGLTLASSSGSASVLAGLDGPVSPHVSGLSDSGRALSLLTSHPWVPRGGAASGSMSLALTAPSDVTLEQFISESRNAFSPRAPQSLFLGSPSGNADSKLFRQQPSREMQLSNRGGDSTTRDQQQQQQQRGVLSGYGIGGGFETHSVLSIMQQPEYRALQAPNSSQRPTIDLMQIPSPPAHSQFQEFAALYDSQQLM